MIVFVVSVFVALLVVWSLSLLVAGIARRRRSRPHPIDQARLDALKQIAASDYTPKRHSRKDRS